MTLSRHHGLPQNLSGWKDIGIQSDGITSGTMATGLGLLTRVHTGCRRVMMDGSSSLAIGLENKGGWNMITAGTETTTETTTGITTGVATVVTTGVTIEVTTKAKTTTANRTL